MNKYLAMVAFGLSSWALAQALPPFDEVDSNGDGRINASEADAVEGFDFRRADANEDGALNRQEYEAQRDE